MFKNIKTLSNSNILGNSSCISDIIKLCDTLNNAAEKGNVQYETSYNIHHKGSYAVITFPLAGYNKEEIEVSREESKIIVKTNPQKEIINEIYKLDPDIFDVEKVKELTSFQDNEVSTIIELPKGFENSKYFISFVNGLLLIILKEVETKRHQTMKIQ